MARADVKDGVLRGCPVCGTPVEEAALGLRDFRWVNEVLPNHIGGMDVDFVLSQARSQRALHLELKPRGAPLSRGARLTLALYVQLGLDAWVVWDLGDGQVRRGLVDPRGQVRNIRTMTVTELAEDVAAWWDAGLQEERDGGG